MPAHVGITLRSITIHDYVNGIGVGGRPSSPNGRKSEKSRRRGHGRNTIVVTIAVVTSSVGAYRGNDKRKKNHKTIDPAIRRVTG